MASNYIEVKRNNILDEAMGGTVVRSGKGMLVDWQTPDTDIVVDNINPVFIDAAVPTFDMETSNDLVVVDYTPAEIVDETVVVGTDETDTMTAPVFESNGLTVGYDEESNSLVTNESFTYTNASDVLFISNDIQKCIFNTGAGEDTINILGSENTIKAGADNDVLIVGTGSGNGNKLYGEEGNDMLLVTSGSDHVLNGGSGNDNYVISKLTSKGSYIIEQTTAGAKDRDILSLTQYNAKDFTFKVNKNGELVITHINGSNITVKGWNNHALSAIEVKEGTITASDINNIAKSVEPATTISVMHAFMESLDETVKKGFAAVDEAVLACSRGMYGNLNDLVESFISDCKKYSGSSIVDRKDFLNKFCGINLDNTDTGAITGYDAGGKVVKTAESVVKESIGINGFIYNTKNFEKITAVDLSGFITGQRTNYSSKQDFYGVKVNGVTLYWNESNWSSLGVDTKVIRQIVGGIINSWAEAGLNLIEESYGLTLAAEDSTLQRLADGSVGLQLYFTNTSNNSSIASVNSSRYYSGNITTLTYEIMNINLNYYLNGCGNENGVSCKAGAGYLDRTIAHELTHAVMSANINSHGNLPTFIKEGLAELVHGIDDQRTNSMLNLVNTGSANGLEEMLHQTFDLNNTSTLYGTYSYAGGYMLLRYMAKQVADASKNSDVSMNFSFADLLTGTGYDSDFSCCIPEDLNKMQDAMISFADTAIDFGSVIESNNFSTYKNNMVYGKC